MVYFSEKLNPDLKKIYFHRIITAVAVQFAGIFSIIFLYELFGNNHQSVILLYVALALATIVVLPTLGYFINRFSYKTSVIVGSLFRLLTWISYFVTSYYDWKFGVIFIAISLVGIRVFYWVPYHTEFITFRKESDHAKSISVLNSINNVVGIFAPFVAGVVLAYFSYNILYGVGIFFLLLAMWPLKNISHLENSFDWKYFEVFNEIKNKKNKAFVLSAMFNGAESMLQFMWPIFIFTLLQGDYLKIGIISTLTTLIVIMLNLIIGKYTDQKKTEKTFLKYGTFLYSIGWFIKIFVTTAGHIFFIDIYHKVSSAIYTGSYHSLMYGYAVDKGHLADEYTLIRETSFRIGQGVSAIIVFFLSFFMSINYLFIVAAFAILLINFVPNRHHKPTINIENE